ncbi:hypothetical protein MHK_005364 [Candidatus Magnetomorum sp. HK-1]|nr:hypothetical protein MHK_005364 [Candidatus Magnetomorum sp. HK-1]
MGAGLPVREFQFQSLPGNSKIVGRCYTSVNFTFYEFQSLPGNSKIVGEIATAPTLASILVFQSLPGNSKIVGRVMASHDKYY